MDAWVSHLEELEQHVIEVGGDVNDADGWLLLACGERERVSLLPPLKVEVSKRVCWLPSGAVTPLQERLRQYCQTHSALSHTLASGL